MSRKREDGVPGPTWGEQMRMRAEGEQLRDADDEAIHARAEALGMDPRRLRAFVLDARRRRG